MTGWRIVIGHLEQENKMRQFLQLKQKVLTQTVSRLTGCIKKSTSWNMCLKSQDTSLVPLMVPAEIQPEMQRNMVGL